MNKQETEDSICHDLKHSFKCNQQSEWNIFSASSLWGSVQPHIGYNAKNNIDLGKNWAFPSSHSLGLSY